MSRANFKLISATLCLLTLMPAIAQNTGQPLTSFADALRAHGIQISPPSLVAALRNSDPAVRSLAAHKLAEDHNLEAIPSIESALSAEKDLQARVDIASALWSIGDPVGLNHLEAMCIDASMPVSIEGRIVRQLAVANLSHPHSGSVGKCAGGLVAALERPSQYDDWLEILTLLPTMYRDVPTDQAGRMVMDAENLLSDRTPAIRMAASQALAEIGSARSVDLMRGAVGREGNPVVRDSLQRDLATLEKIQ